MIIGVPAEIEDNESRGAVSRTSRDAWTNATLPYALQIAEQGWREAVVARTAMAKGMNVIGGWVVCRGVAGARLGLSQEE